MRPQLVLMLSALLPVEARLSYLGLRHAAYAAPGTSRLLLKPLPACAICAICCLEHPTPRG